ncbi:MAG TPA: protein phosphatase 2C domain-containing protein [Acidimicrobiales bacterium]|nr:protein phosphatase 2C domain-containing protein [Acidimicrobiales bacterium]
MPLRSPVRASDAGYRAEGAAGEDFVVLGASVAGVAHRLNRKRCEDAFGWAQPAPGKLGLVVADGVSTAGRGGEGAEIAVGAACGHLLRLGSRWGQVECSGAVVSASEEITEAGGAAAGQLSTTIVVALVALDLERGQANAVVASAGDSSAFTLDQDGTWSELLAGSPSNDAELAALEGLKPALPSVLPLPSTSFSDREGALLGVQVATVELPRGTGLVLLTDGVADPLRDGPSSVAPRLAEVLLRAADAQLSPLALAAAADFSRRGAHDDRTILVAWPRFDRPGTGRPHQSS